jgi:hypothetical protein
MRNKRLHDILYSIAYDKGHAYGMEEVENIHQGLCYELKEIDDMLPYTMPPKFNVGDKVHWIAGFSGEIIGIITLEYNGYQYQIDITESEDLKYTLVPENELTTI